MLRADRADGAGQALRPARAGELAEVQMPVSDPGALGREHEIAGEHQFQSARHARAVYRRNVDPVGALDRVQQIVEIAQELAKSSRRR
jgi:hypothetical protein